MAAVQRGAKINFYKFVDPKGGVAASKSSPLVKTMQAQTQAINNLGGCLLYTSPSPRDRQKSRMPSSA